MKQYIESECKCQECINMCKNTSCWPIPEEAEKLIKAGFGDKLMEDYWVDEENNYNAIYLIIPAIKGLEGESASFMNLGKCTFLDKNNLCKLHNLKLKPLEGKVVSCKPGNENIREHIAKEWNSEKGKKLVEKWRKEFLQ